MRFIGQGRSVTLGQGHLYIKLETYFAGKPLGQF